MIRSNRDHNKDFIAFLIITTFVFAFFYPVITELKTINPCGFTFVWPPFHMYKGGQDLPYNPVASDFADSMYPGIYFLYNSIKSGTGFAFSNSLALGPENNITLIGSSFFSLDFLLVLLLGPPWGITTAVLMRFTIAGVATYLFLRQFKVSRLACLGSAISFTYCSQSVVNTWLPYLYSLPLLFLGTERLIHRKNLLNTFLLLIGYYCALTSGQVVWSIHLILLQISYAAYRVLVFPNSLAERRKLLVLFGFTGLSALAVIMFMILPSIEHNQFLNLEYRASHGKRAASHNLNLYFFLPRISGDFNAPFSWGGNAVENTYYSGVAPLLLFLIGIFSKRIRLKLFFVTTAALIYIIVTNSFNFLELVSKLPFFDNSPPTRLRFLWSFLLACGAALGFEFLLLSAPNRSVKSILSFLLLVCVIIGGTYLMVSLYHGSNYSIDLSNSQILTHLKEQFLILLVSLILIGVIYFARRKTVPAAFLIVLIFADLFINTRSYPQFLSADMTFPQMRVTDYLKSVRENDSRFLPLERSFISYFSMPYGLSSIQPRGWYTARQKEFLRLIDPGALEVHPTMYFFSWKNTNYKSPILDLLNVKHLVATHGLLDSETIERMGSKWKLYYNDELEIYTNMEAPQPAFILENAIIRKSDSEILQELQRSNLKDTIVIEDEKIVWEKAKVSQVKNKRIDLVSFTDDKYVFRTNTNFDGYLVFSKFYHPAWKAYIDRKPTQIFTANYTLMGIKVPSGQHKIGFRFEPQYSKVGFWISVIAGVILATMYILLWFRDHHSKRNSI